MPVKTVKQAVEQFVTHVDALANVDLTNLEEEINVAVWFHFNTSEEKLRIREHKTESLIILNKSSYVTVPLG